MKVVVLVDGEHYPPVTRWAIDELRGRGLDPIAALFVGGGEKLDPSAALDLGIPLRGSVPDRSVATALAGAIDELGPEGIFDLSDEPVLGYRERMEVAAVTLARGIAYLGPDFRLDPPVDQDPLPVATIAVIGIGKRTGKTAVSGETARVAAAHGFDPVVVAMGRGGPPEPEVAEAGTVTLDALLELARRGYERRHHGGCPARGRWPGGALLVDQRPGGRRGRAGARRRDRDRRRERGVDAPVPVGRGDPGRPGDGPPRVSGRVPRPPAPVAIGSCRCYHGA